MLLSSLLPCSSLLALSAALLLLSGSRKAAAFQLQSEYIYTDEVAYCSKGRAVEVDRFDIRYYRENKSIGFDISARSVAPNLNADLNIELFAYGKNYINITANMCDVLSGALCPLPEYQFDGNFQYILPDSVNINLPGIAYSVPDLDATAKVRLINQANGSQALCLTASLSNGKSVYLGQVQWAAGGLAIGAFLVALIHSFWPLSPTKSGPEWRFATIITFFQHIALCGFLSLDYPVVYKMFTLNFAWAQGLIYMGPINAAITRMRLMTGGLDRSGQTYEVVAEATSSATSNATSTTATSFIATNTTLIPEVQEAPSYSIVSGIETTAEFMGITYANAFMTVFFVFLFLACVMIAIFAVATATVLIYAKLKHRTVARDNLVYFIWTNTLRTVLLAYSPIVLFVFWQFMHRTDSGWLAILIAVITFVLVHVTIFGIHWHLRRVVARKLASEGSEPTSLRWSTVRHQFKKSGQGYIFVLAAAAILSSAFVAFAQGRGLVQLAPLIVIEVLVFLTFCIWRPFANRGSTILMITISLFKIASYAVMVVFYYKVSQNLSGILIAVLGFVIIAIQGAMVMILFIVTIYNLGAGLLWARGSRKRGEDEKYALMTEKRANSGALLSPEIGRADEDPNHEYPPVSSLYIPPPGSDDSDSSAGTPDSTIRPGTAESLSDDTTVVGTGSEIGTPKQASKKRFSNMFWYKGHSTKEEDEDV